MGSSSVRDPLAPPPVPPPPPPREAEPTRTDGVALARADVARDRVEAAPLALAIDASARPRRPDPRSIPDLGRGAEGLARAAIAEPDAGRAARLAVRAASVMAADGAALIEALSPQKVATLFARLALDDRRFVLVGRFGEPPPDVPAATRRRAAARLLEAARGSRDASVAAVATVFATYDARALRHPSGEALAAALATTLGVLWSPDDPAAATAHAQRMQAVLRSRRGQSLLFAREAPAAARLDMLRLFRARSDWTAARLEEGPADPWANDALLEAAFAPRADEHLALRGDAPVALAGSDLDNTIGVALNLPPSVPEAAPEAEQAAARGAHSYFDAPGVREVVTPIAEQIRAAGGPQARLTVLPIQFASKAAGRVQLALFRVADPDTGAERFVDNTGRLYTSFEDWAENNVLPPGRVTFPAGGHMGALESAATPRTVDTVGEVITQGLDVAALVGGTIAGGAVLLGSGGTAAPLVALLAGAWIAGRSGETLMDRDAHGQSIDPFESPEARGAWLDVAAGAVGVGALGAAASLARMSAAGSRALAIARIGASVTNGAATALDAAAAFDAGHTLLSQWDQLPAAQRAMLLLSVGFWSAQTGAQLKLRGAFDITARREALGQQVRPSEEAAQTLRSRGFRDTVGLAGEASETAREPFLRAIARGRARAESLGRAGLARIRGLFEPSAALRRERDGLVAEVQRLWTDRGAALQRAYAKPEGLRSAEEAALVARAEDLGSKQAVVDGKIREDLRRRRRANQEEATTAMKGMLARVRGSGVSRDRAVAMAGEVTLTARARAAFAKAGVNEKQLRGWLADFFMITTKTRPPKALKIDVRADRAQYLDGSRTVDLGKTFGASESQEQKRILFHELAHSIEHANPEVGEASKAWVRARAEAAGEGDAVHPLSTLDPSANYDPKEVAREDHFLNPYIGKVYEHGPGSEVLSMALEDFTNPELLMGLYAGDPELFYYVMGVLR